MMTGNNKTPIWRFPEAGNIELLFHAVIHVFFASRPPNRYVNPVVGGFNLLIERMLNAVLHSVSEQDVSLQMHGDRMGP